MLEDRLKKCHEQQAQELSQVEEKLLNENTRLQVLIIRDMNAPPPPSYALAALCANIYQLDSQFYAPNVNEFGINGCYSETIHSTSSNQSYYLISFIKFFIWRYQHSASIVLYLRRLDFCRHMEERYQTNSIQ